MNSLDRPLLIFDGRCGFCRAWIDYWRQLTGDTIAYAPSQEVGPQFPQIDPERFAHSVELVLPGGEVLEGAAAVFRTLADVRGQRAWQRAYDYLPGFASLAEFGYRIVAAHRDVFYWLTRLTFGIPLVRSTYQRTQWLFWKLLAVVYAVAFASLLPQLRGLLGQHGILPAGEYLRQIHDVYGARGYWLVPSVFWFGSSEGVLLGAAATGLALALLALLGVRTRLMLALLVGLYLSFLSVGQAFLSFQWDLLLIEAGFLALFCGIVPGSIWLFRWLLFRLYFLSGAVKLLSGDATWQGLTALRYHYETQPLPTPLAWYAHQWPDWWQRICAGFVFSVELLVPMLIFAPRRLRQWAAVPLMLLQVLIFLTGNYTFFNLLTLALCVFLFDDQALGRLVPRALPTARIGRLALLPIAVVVLGSVLAFWQTLRGPLPRMLNAVVGYVAPFGFANSYGLFAVMTTTRPEIIVEGSRDGVQWQAYEFSFKPGDVRRAPRWVAPYQPRLDWQMWFAALGDYQDNPWFISFLTRLLEGSPSVRGLLSFDPFGEAAPKYVRAVRYQYHFTHAGADWWTREIRDVYVPPVALRH